MEKRGLDNNEKLLLLGILHYVAAIFLIIVKFAPFNIDLYDLYLTEHTSNVLLIDTITVGTLLYALTITRKRNLQKTCHSLTGSVHKHPNLTTKSPKHSRISKTHRKKT